MQWLRNKDNGNIYSVDAESPEQWYLREIKSSEDNRPLYEEIGLQEVASDQPNLPFEQFTIVKYVGPVNTAGDTVNTSLGLAPADGTIIDAVLVSQEQIVGEATNYRTIQVSDLGTPADSGAAYVQNVPVVLASQQFNAATVEDVVGQEFDLTLGGTVAVSSGDILRVSNVPSGTGETMSDFVVLLTFNRKS